MKTLITLLSFTMLMFFAQISNVQAISLAKSATTEVVAKKEIVKKESAGSLDKTLYIILAIVGLGFIGLGVNTDWKGSTWIIGLLLSCLFWLPGVIYALIKMKDFYK
jgi:uncharacterized membrane protein YqaE (UPF0057 family)